MADLQKALSIPCAYAAGEFTDTGELVADAGNISLKTAKMAAMMCAADKMMGKMQASGWTDYTGKDGFEPSGTTQPAVGRRDRERVKTRSGQVVSGIAHDDQQVVIAF